MDNNLIKIADIIRGKDSVIDSFSDRDNDVIRFLNFIQNMCNNGATYFQLDDKVINEFNRESSILRRPIVKIMDKNLNIMSYIDIKEQRIDLTLAKNSLIMFGLSMIN